MVQNQHYSFYKKRGVHPHLDTKRVYPFSHQYGANITIRTAPINQAFHSSGVSTLEGILEKDVTVQDYFGTDKPKIQPIYILTYEQRPLGVRFQAVPTNSAFVFDVELGKLSPHIQETLLSRLPHEEMLLMSDGNFTTYLEQTEKLYIVDISECLQLTKFINNYYTE